jgi:hypothetical protein
MVTDEELGDEARRLPAHELRRVSVAAGVDPRTVARVIAGAATRGLQRERVERALRATGHADLLGGEDRAR